MQFKRILLILVGFLPSSHAVACWKGVEPRGFASRCPIVVTGTITKIDAGCPCDNPSYDIAHITISAIHKNRLKDVPLSNGSVIQVRMAARDAKIKTSTDLRYPLKDKALWLIVLDANGQFSLNSHPVQRQPLDKDPKTLLGELFNMDKTGKWIGTHTKAEWIAWLKANNGHPGKESKQSESGSRKR